MTATTIAALLAADLIAITVLALAVYNPRHHRRDMVTAFFGINVGVFAVTAAMANSSVGAGLGLGLLGVLSIIRLRSDEIGQREVAYYFASLAIGLLGGLSPTPLWISFAGMALVVVVMYLADSSKLAPRSRNELIILDRAIADETELTLHLEALLGATVRKVNVQRLDLINDSTWVDVRYVINDGAARPHKAVTSAREPLSAAPTIASAPTHPNQTGARR